MSKNQENTIILDGLTTVESIDTSGEIVEVEGCDISSLEDGNGFLNCEHISPGEKAGAQSTFNTIIGHIIYAKKIFKESDCKNEREKFYWNQVKLPCIYIKAALFNAENHENAQATAAIIRYCTKNKIPLLLKYSLEGHTVDRSKTEPNRITCSVARNVALTLKPANKASIAGVFEDASGLVPEKPIVKSELSYYITPYIPYLNIYMESLKKNTQELQDINKTMAVGGTDVAPSSLTGTAALATEDVGSKKKIYKALAKALVRDWNSTEEFEYFIKNKLPDIDPIFIDNFNDYTDEIDLKNIKLKKHLYEINKLTKLLH